VSLFDTNRHVDGPRYVIADIEPAVFLGNPYDVERARLEIRFWYPQGVDYEYYQISWIEPTRDLMLGFHQDGGHPELGRCHVQLDHESTTVDRAAISVDDSHPLAVLDTRIEQFADTIAAIQWQDEPPSLSKWPPDR